MAVRTREGHNAAPRDVEALPCKHCVGRKLNICKPLDGKRLTELMALGGLARWKKREILFRAGDPIGPFFKIRSGIVAVSRVIDDGRRQIVALRAPGDCIGYLEEGGRYVFEGHALTVVEACAFDRRQFDAYATKHPDLAAATAGALAAALQQAGQSMLVLGQLNSIERLAHFLVEIDALYRDRGVSGKPLSLFMGRGEIADYLGLTLETVSRAFGKLKSRGIIDLVESDEVVILDRTRLRELSKA